MSIPFQLTSRALNDLDEIWSYIAADSVEAANRVESAILAACSGLVRHPQLGSKRTEITSRPVRFWTVSRFPNFIVVYRPNTVPLQAVAVLHGKRNVSELLDEPGSYERAHPTSALPRPMHRTAPKLRLMNGEQERTGSKDRPAQRQSSPQAPN